MTDSTDNYTSEELRQLHTPEAIRARIASSSEHSYVGDFVLGAVDGTVTTFAIVAGAAGANLSAGVAIVLGVANVFADGMSMAASNYLKARSDQAHVERYRRIEEMHVDTIPNAERAEVREIFRRKGFEGNSLDDIVQVITSDRQRWIDTMLAEEWGLQIDLPSPRAAAAATFFAFLIAGFVPLFPLFFMFQSSANDVFLMSAILTAISFVSIGYLRGKVSQVQRPWWAALETLLIGGVAALLAYGVGDFLEGIVH